MFDESALKLALIKSLRHQGGDGFRIEDKYRTGVPDMIMMAPEGPPPGGRTYAFLIEAKIVRGTKLVCTDMQAHYLERFHKPPGMFAAIIGFSDSRGALYIGQHDMALTDCRFVPRPARLASSDWLIADLLWKMIFDERRVDVG